MDKSRPFICQKSVVQSRTKHNTAISRTYAMGCNENIINKTYLRYYLCIVSNILVMGLLPDTSNLGLHMRRECRERFPRHRLKRKPLVSDPGIHHGTCVTHVPWCMSGSLTRWRGKRSRHARRMRNPQILRIWSEAHVNIYTKPTFYNSIQNQSNRPSASAVPQNSRCFAIDICSSLKEPYVFQSWIHSLFATYL